MLKEKSIKVVQNGSDVKCNHITNTQKITANKISAVI